MSEVILSAEGEDAMLELGGRIALASGGQGDLPAWRPRRWQDHPLARHPARPRPCRLGEKPDLYPGRAYEIGELRAYHFDLYRLADAEELEFFGIRDYFDGSALCLIEWPERGAGVLPTADLDITITAQAGGRTLRLVPHGARGEAWCATLTMGA